MFNLVVTCVGSKNLKGPSIGQVCYDLICRDVKNDVDALFSEWRKRLNKFRETAPSWFAKDLYKGAMWSASLEAFEEVSGPKELWIISCGFGLISSMDRICGYGATFACTGEPEKDSIYNRNFFTRNDANTVNRKWWNLLSDEGILKVTQHPLSINDLFNHSQKGDVILIAAGKHYYEAIFDDLNHLNVSSDSPDLALVGVKKLDSRFDPKIPDELSSYVIPYRDGSKLQNFLSKRYGCSRIQLHPKSALHVIKQYNRSKQFDVIFP